jgi:hypothetical protein
LEEIMTRPFVLVVAVILFTAQIGTVQAGPIKWLIHKAERAAEKAEKERPSERIIPKTAGEMSKGAAEGAIKGKEESDEKEKEENDENESE